METASLHEWLQALSTAIAALEHAALDDMSPAPCDPTTFVAPTDSFSRLRGLEGFWDLPTERGLWASLSDLLIGAHDATARPVTLLVTGTPQSVNIYCALGDATKTTALLTGFLPGIALEPVTRAQITAHLAPHFATQGVISGIPSAKSQGDDGAAAPLDRLIHGMQGHTWGYAVQAFPEARDQLLKERQALLDMLSVAGAEWQFQRGTPQRRAAHAEAELSQPGHGRATAVDNQRAGYLRRLLERERERLDVALACGRWRTSVAFGANTMPAARALRMLAQGTLSDAASRPNPLRTFLCAPDGDDRAAFATSLSAPELALLTHLPSREAPGYALRSRVQFALDYVPRERATIAVGAIQQDGRDAGTTYHIALDDLTKHALIAGVTGSGKTTTTMAILSHSAAAGVPFLVIEPTKTEYRPLRNAISGDGTPRIYTLGNETVAPFRFNPFEFETNDEPESAVILSHIDFLKAVFNAAFILYVPMPHVLETALHEVYEDKGWDLATGRNLRLSDWSERQRYPIFPTLTDLYDKVEIVTERLGYHDEVERNVKAGLRARIGSLRIGAKGLMLDTARGMSMHDLLAHATILELESIGSDDEKTFLLGLLLARMYEFRRTQASAGAIPAGLQHVLVFEEAHRILMQTTTQVDVESSNPRAQAIEVFTNMLAEVRAYGQGVIVVEQIPGKLAPDVLKNTNVKIVHRLTAQDDRLSVGQTMNLTPMQMRHLGVLAPGMATLYAEGAEQAYLLRIANVREPFLPLSDAQLKTLSPTYISLVPYQTIPDLADYGLPQSRFGGPEARLYQYASRILESAASKEQWATIMLRAIFSPGHLPAFLFTRLTWLVEAALPQLAREGQHQMMLEMLVARGAATAVTRHGLRVGWSYPQIDEMRGYLTRGLLALLRSREFASPRRERAMPTESPSLLSAEGWRNLKRFATQFRRYSQRAQGPYPGCVHCRHKCFYREMIPAIMSPKDRTRVDQDLTSGTSTEFDERVKQVADGVRSMANRWLGNFEHVTVMSLEPDDIWDDAEESTSDIGLCAALYALTQSDFTEYEQEFVGNSVIPHLHK